MWNKNYKWFGCTYVLYSTRDYLIRYVGATTSSTTRRLYYHVYNVRRGNQREKNQWIKSELSSGYEIRIKTVSYACDKKDLDERERSLILALKERGYLLLNVYEGGVSGFHIPDSQKEHYHNLYYGKKLSEERRSAIIEYYKNNSSPLIGLKRSDETRNRISASMKGVASKRRLPVNMFDLNMVFVRRFESITEAADTLGVCLSGIANCLAGRSKTCNKHIFKYANNES